MINSRISGNNALKLTQGNCNVNDYNRSNLVLHKNRINKNRKHKWRLKESYRNFYVGVAECMGLLVMIVCILLFAFGVGY
jgi:hypothetical protein